MTPSAHEVSAALANNIAIMSPYRFHVFELAGQMASRGALRRLLTAMPRRTVTEAPAEFVLSHPNAAVLRHAWNRLRLPNDSALNRLVVRDFDKWAATQLSTERLVIALSGCSTRSLSVARQMGMKTVCDRGSWHVLEQQRVLEEEASRWGWPMVPFDPWLVERELEEYETSDVVTVPSEPARRSFLRRGFSSGKIGKARYGVDVERFRRSATTIRDPRRVICVGPVGLRKGHQYLLPAYRRARRPDSSLVLVGQASSVPVRLLELSDPDVQILGAVSRDRVAAELGRSGVFALASVEEGLALVIGQAMAAGLPVVATEATGAEELITDGAEGFIVPTGDEDRLTEALDVLLADEGLARSMGEAGRRRMEGLGGWDRYGHEALTIYDHLVS